MPYSPDDSVDSAHHRLIRYLCPPSRLNKKSLSAPTRASASNPEALAAK